MLSESVQNDVTHLRERIVEKYYPKTKVTRVTDQELGLLDVMRPSRKLSGKESAVTGKRAILE